MCDKQAILYTHRHEKVRKKPSHMLTPLSREKKEPERKLEKKFRTELRELLLLGELRSDLSSSLSRIRAPA